MIDVEAAVSSRPVQSVTLGDELLDDRRPTTPVKQDERFNNNNKYLFCSKHYIITPEINTLSINTHYKILSIQILYKYSHCV